MKIFKNLILYSVGCVICGKSSKTAICKNCIKQFIFSIPQNLINRQYFFTKKHIFFQRNNTYFLSQYKYNYISKKLLIRIKQQNNRVGLWAITTLFEYYINIDPFNIFRKLKILLKNKKLLIFILPSNPNSKFYRNLNPTYYIARIFISYITKKHNTTIIKCKNIIKINKKSLFQKQLHKIQRFSQAKSQIFIDRTKCVTCLKSYTQGLTSYNIYVLIVDDVTTTGATLFYAKNKINTCLKSSTQKNIKYFLFTMFNVEPKAYS